MYFGTLCVGADVAGGLMAVRAMSQRKEKFSFVFKDYRAEFLKRPESDVVFTCADGKVIQELVERAAKSGNREELKVLVTATCPKMSKDKVARFELTLSIKKSSK
jgi:translation initiation factor 2B subunit (eIF-2B alpha/beta/delta family)